MKRALAIGLLLAAGMIPAFAMKKASSNEPAADKTSPAAAPKTLAPNRVFELRTYTTNGGKLEDLHKRFHDHTCRLLKKHGAELIGFWTPMDEADGKGTKLVYLVAFPSREAAKKSWDSFGKDPEWRKVYEESHRNGKLVKAAQSVFLEPTEYSEMK
jgi:hypothetical protein